MNERINYEKQCAFCKWADNTQAQCFDGHIQNIAGCKSFEVDNAEITTKDLEIATMKLYTVMARFGTSHLKLRFKTGIAFDACFGPDEKRKKADKRESNSDIVDALLLALERSNAGKIPEESKEESNDSTPETQQEVKDG